MSVYTLKVQTEISAAHSLRGYDGDCARVHGHNWKILCEIKTTKLNEIGIGIDFKDLKKSMKEIANILDHQYINEIPPFNEINPTAENISKWFYDMLKPIINDADTKLSAVTIWETDRSSVRYSEE